MKIKSKIKTRKAYIGGASLNASLIAYLIPGLSGESAERKSYLYLGHGNEIVDLVEGRHIPRVVDVLDNCTITTTTSSGLSSYMQQTDEFIKLSIEYPEYLLNPFETFDNINEYFKTCYDPEHYCTNVKLSVHIEKDKFIEKHCNFLRCFEEEGNSIKLCKSGLYLSTHIPNLSYIGTSAENRVSSHIATIDKTGNISIDTIIAMYNGSIYPTLDLIVSNISVLLQGIVQTNNILDSNDLRGREIPYLLFVHAVNMCCKKNVSELMIDYPGNHYYLCCRNYSHYVSLKNATEKRGKSNNNVRRMFGHEPVIQFDLAKDQYERFIIDFMNDQYKHLERRSTYQSYNTALNQLEKILELPHIRVHRDGFVFGDFLNRLITELKDHIDRGYFTSANVVFIEKLKHLMKTYPEITQINFNS